MKYDAWILEHVVGDGYGQCRDVTASMVAAFPELTRVRGHYHCPVWGRRGHWWCVTASGTVVDPTQAQFPSRATGHYEPWPEGAEEPTGKCLNCGEYAYRSWTFCSDECEAACATDFNIRGYPQAEPRP